MTMTKLPNCPKTGKESFDTELDAMIKMSNIVMSITRHRKHRFREEPIRAYQCEFCHHWHTTSQAKRRGS